VIVRLYKPSGATTNQSAAVGTGINTYGTSSTTTMELFVDEARRLMDINSVSPDWNSSTALGDGHAQVYPGTNTGAVGYPLSGDYPGFSAVEQIYQRHFTKNSASSATLVFGGINFSHISSYGTGNLNLIIRLDDDDLYFDAGLAFGASNGNGSGDTFVNSIGCLLGTSSGTTLNITFGTNSTANNQNRYRAILIFRNNIRVINSITTS
jgi:hypothetical protein